MNTQTLLLVLVICIAEAYARHLDDNHSPDPLTDVDQSLASRKHSDSRHRRRRWQMNYGYEYPVPSHGFYPDRREYDRNQDILPRILSLLEEITAYVKRPAPPPPPPQPIYIPYPVPYPVPQYALPSCAGTGGKQPNVTNRFPEMEDTNQNWGFVAPEDDDADDGNDGARPISFDPIRPKRPLKRPSPKVEHGSFQDESQPSTEAPRFAASAPGGVLRTPPNMCNAAILSCCTGEQDQQRQCFVGFGCAVSYDNGRACTSDSISEALESFKATYSPRQQ